MTTFLVLIVLVVLALLTFATLIIMANISTLIPRLQDLQGKVDSISVNVQILKDQLATAGEIPAEAEALLSNLGSTLDALAANVQPPQSGPLP